MTKIELMRMIENLNDSEQVQFIAEGSDRDGFHYDLIITGIYKVLGENAKPVKKEYGIIRYE